MTNALALNGVKPALLQISILVIMTVGWDVAYLAASRFSSALMYSASSFSLPNADVLPDPFGPARIVHVGMDYRVIT